MYLPTLTIFFFQLGYHHIHKIAERFNIQLTQNKMNTESKQINNFSKTG